MIQLTHLGRRTRWDTGDWLSAVSAGVSRRTGPSLPAEDWDIERIIADAAAAERMQAAGLDGIELEAYGHLIDQFWGRAHQCTSTAGGGSLDNRMRSLELLKAIRDRVGDRFPVGVRLIAGRVVQSRITRAEG